jgi:hypothetical protein
LEREVWHYYPTILTQRKNSQTSSVPRSERSGRLYRCSGQRATFSVEKPDIPQLSSFLPTNEEEIKKLVLSLPARSCTLDPIPTGLLNLKRCLSPLLPILVRIINISLELAHVPSSLKFAVIRPLLKKPSLERNVLSNYRPVLNLTYLSKLIERIVASRLKAHMSTHCLFDENQSGYRQCHCTETVLLRLANDILMSLNDGKEVLPDLCVLIHEYAKD